MDCEGGTCDGGKSTGATPGGRGCIGQVASMGAASGVSGTGMTVAAWTAAAGAGGICTGTADDVRSGCWGGGTKT
eukprot:9262656-Alexandrium_andersonii.AAC.1